MKMWLDTEFIEDGRTIDLISIGIVAEDGREYYAINSECKFENASDWVWKNVLYPIGIYQPLKHINPSDPSISANTLESVRAAKSRRQIANDAALFCGCEVSSKIKLGMPGQPATESPITRKLKPDSPTPEFWAYYADYDWVVFCQLFGTMMDLPEGFPMYCRDLKQECDRLGNPELPERGKSEHNALADARWNKQAWEFLDTYSKREVTA